MTEAKEAVPVEVKALMLDPSSNLPIVILHEPKSDRHLPIWIGLFEAQAIAMSLEGISSPRPMTHDLLFQSFSEMGANIVQVVISDLRESTFYAEIMIESSSGRHTIDARPSDAIALALRAEAAVLVNPEVLDTALKGPLLEKIGSEEEIRKWLETAEPEEFGKYKM